jgi:hypothetical protein
MKYSNINRNYSDILATLQIARVAKINVGLKIQNYALSTWKLRKICYIYSENVVLLKNELVVKSCKIL